MLLLLLPIHPNMNNNQKHKKEGLITWWWWWWFVSPLFIIRLMGTESLSFFPPSNFLCKFVCKSPPPPDRETCFYLYKRIVIVFLLRCFSSTKPGIQQYPFCCSWFPSRNLAHMIIIYKKKNDSCKQDRDNTLPLHHPLLAKCCPNSAHWTLKQQNKKKKDARTLPAQKTKGKKKKNQDLGSGQHFVQNNTPKSNKCEDLKIWGFYGG